MHRGAQSLIVLVFALFVLAPAGLAHKGITSKFTYNGEVHAIFLKRCGRCHIEGGVGPMSLLKYQEAFPWAEAVRTEMLGAPAGHPHDFVSAAHRQISARELDIILDWVTGGTPEGDQAQTPPETQLRIDWAAGPPDLIAKMPNRYQMNVMVDEATHESAMSVPTSSPVSVSRIDVLPGNAAIVRSAVLSLRSPGGGTQLLGTWVPRQVPTPITLKPAVRVEPGSEIVARIHYKKTWKHEGELMTDLSVVGLYFAN